MFSSKKPFLLGTNRNNRRFGTTNVITQNTNVARNPSTFRRYLQQEKSFILNGNIARRRIPAERRVGIDSAIKFNILIRNTYRPSSSAICLNSILRQSYQNFKIIMCYDDDHCLKYLNKYKTNPKIEIFKATDVDKNNKRFYNLYCNELLTKTVDGWIMFLDDDDMFATDNALKIIANSLKTTNDIVFWKFLRPDTVIYPNINILQMDTIASCGYCFHSKYKNLSKWEIGQRGDYNFIYHLTKKINFNRYFINDVLTKTTWTDMKAGNFGKKEERKLKYSIIMAYYNRKKQTQLTLDQFERLYANKYDFEVVIVDDCSKETEKLNDIVNNYSFKIKYIELKNKTWINPVVPMNIAITNISWDVDIVIFQNPETFHCGDIFNNAKNIKLDEYFVYPVFNSPSYDQNNKLKILFDNNCSNYYDEFINKIEYRKYRGEWDDRLIDVWKGWLQHKDLNNRQLHFLTAISMEALNKVGGFCNEMKDGLWYDDDEFLSRIKKVANCISIESNILIGIHQKHSGGSNENMKTKNDQELKIQNYNIFMKNKQTSVTYCHPIIDIEYNNIISVTIVMAYYNRKPQTLETLKGFERMYTGKYNFEVVIVDDNSNDENKLEEDIKQFTFPINLIVISAEEKGNRVNPCIPYNRGFAETKGDIIIIQNPECYHYTDVISKIINLDFYNNYYSSPVISSPSYTHNDFIKNNRLSSDEMINYLENENLKYPYHYCKGWYNHPHLSSLPESRHLHFCSAIHRNNLDILMGFDENYKNGSWYDDNEFLFRIKKFLNCSFLDSLVIHQFHEVGSAVENNDESLKDKILLNKKLYEELQKTNNNEYITWKNNNSFEINFKKKEKKHGIAISVFSDNLTPEVRILKSIRCIKSIVKFFPKFPIFIIIDGSITSKHLNQLQKMKTINENVKIFKLSQNKGISYIKNICINFLKEICDYMYLLDDDIEIKKNNLDKLIENTFSKNNIPLITNFKYINNNIVIKNGIKYIYLEKGFSQAYGNLIVINKWYLSKYGYFYILKHKWGYEHHLLTTFYLKNTEYKNLGLLDLKEYIYDGDEDDLHLHCNKNLNYKACRENLIIGKEILKTNKYNLFFKNNLKLQEI